MYMLLISLFKPAQTIKPYWVINQISAPSHSVKYKNINLLWLGAMLSVYNGAP